MTAGGREFQVACTINIVGVIIVYYYIFYRFIFKQLRPLFVGGAIQIAFDWLIIIIIIITIIVIITTLPGTTWHASVQPAAEYISPCLTCPQDQAPFPIQHLQDNHLIYKPLQMSCIVKHYITLHTSLEVTSCV